MDTPKRPHGFRGKVRIARMPAMQRIAPEQNTIRRKTGSGVISAEYSVNDTRYRL